jgi:hypothetical protein
MSNKPEPRDKRIANSTLAASAGLAAVIYSTQFFDIPKSVNWGIAFLIVGVVGYGYAVYQWSKL